MKINYIITGLLLASCLSCSIDTFNVKDPADAVIGNYSGIQVHQYMDWDYTFLYDTTNVSITVSQGLEDSTIIIFSDPVYYQADSSVFIFEDNRWVSTVTYHPPILNFHDDSLTYEHCPGLAPDCINFYTGKIQD